MDFTVFIDRWAGFEMFLSHLLQNLDPSLFQNIILGILAIFIPFAIVFLTDVLDSKKQRNEFKKMVLKEEVLETKKVFWFSLIGIAILSFFKGTDISFLAKMGAIVFSIVMLFFLSKPFWKILRFSDGYEHEFEIGFLENLTLSKFFRFRNKSKAKRMTRAWDSLWSERSEKNEEKFTEIFIQHIDDAVQSKRYELAISLAQAYSKNLDKRVKFVISNKILPKILEWHENFWDAEQECLNRKRERLQEGSLSKPYLNFRKRVFGLLKKRDVEADSWDSNYFQRELFPAVTKILLGDMHGQRQFFRFFKKHIDQAEAKQEDDYVTRFLGTFCQIFFENINSVTNEFYFKKDVFPEDWKVTMENSTKKVPQFFVFEFFRWADEPVRMGTDYDTALSEVISTIFPDTHYRLLRSFLILLFCGTINNAIQKKPNFLLSGSTIFCSSGKITEEEIGQRLRQQEQWQRNKTIEVIFGYFGGYWAPLQIHRDDLSREEFEGWGGYSSTQSKLIIARIRKTKLKNLLDEIESEKTKNLSQESENHEYQRKDFIDLIQALLQRIS